jgi:hypothetical protein
MYKPYSRRKFIQQSLYATPVLLGSGLVLNACDTKKTARENKETATPVDPCEDFSGVSESELQKRQQLGYVKESPIPDNQCNNCNLYIPPPTGKTCGGCILFQGPVYAGGYCTYWAPKI